MTDTGTDDGPDDGFVLLSVLMVVILFVGLSATLAIKSRLLAMQAANRGAAVRAQAQADGAALFAAAALRPPPTPAPDPMALLSAALSGSAAPPVAPSAPLPLPVDGNPVACALAGGSVAVLRTVDQGGLLDLNGAPVPMLEAFFSAAGLDSQTVTRLAAEVADFRDPDDAPEGTGVGERAQYAAAGLAWGPRNGPFADAGEIAQLPSATPAVVARLRPLLTVENPRAGIDLAITGHALDGLLSTDALGSPAVTRWNLASARDRFAVEARLVSRVGITLAARGAIVSFGNESAGDLALRRWWRPPVMREAAMLQPSDDAFCKGLASALDGSHS